MAGEKRKRMAGDWSDGTPVEILTLIAEKVDSISTCIVFAAVCRSWRAVIAPNGITESAPWLMLAPKQDSASRSFYRFGSDQVFDIEFPPETNGRRCWGSPFGWIITYNSSIDSGMDINLFNPISKASIPLPNLLPYFSNKHPENDMSYVKKFVCRPKYLEKAILTASPESPDCMVVLIPTMEDYLDNDVLYAKPMRDIVWSVIHNADLGDILNFRGNSLYGCKWDTGNIVTLELLDDMELILKEFAHAPPEMIHRQMEVVHEYHRKKYLVDIGGELYLVLRYVNPADWRLPDIEDYSLTSDFEIYKIDLSAKDWKCVKSLGDYCLFIGTANAFAVPVSSCISLMPDCIYFLDDRAFCKQSDGSDIGVFYVGESQFGARPLGENVGSLFDDEEVLRIPTPQPLMLKTLASGLYSHSCPPLWITPYLSFYEHGKTRTCRDQSEAKNMKLTSNIKGNNLPERIVGDLLLKKIVTKIKDVEDEERCKLMIQLKNQFTYTEKHGVNRITWLHPR